MSLAALLCLLLVQSTVQALDPDKPFGQYVSSRWSVQQGFPQVSALKIVQDADGYIWSATQNGLARFDGVQFTVFNLHTTPQLLSSHLEVLFIDSQGRLWIGSAKGISVREGGKFRTVANQDANFGIVTSFAEHPDGRILAGTTIGLWLVESEGLVPLQDIGPVHSLYRSGQTLLAGGQGVVTQLTGDLSQEIRLPSSLAETRISHIADWNGALWLGSDSGLLRYRDGEFDQPLKGDDAHGAAVEMLYVDRNANLWIGTYPALLRLRPDRPIERITSKELGFNPWIVSATEDHEGNLWLGSKTHSLIRLWNGWTHRYSRYEGLSDSFVWSVAHAGDGSLWVGTNSDLSRIRNGIPEQVIKGSRLPNPSVYSLMPRSDDSLWIGTRGGVAWLRDDQLVPTNGLAALDRLQINAMLETAPDTVWIGTDNGLYAWNAGVLTRSTLEGLNENRVRILYLEEETLWIGTENGLFRYSDQQFEKLLDEPNLAQAFVTGMGRLPDGRLAVGTLAQGLFVGQPERWIHLTEDHGLPPGGSFYIAAPGNEYLWIGGETGAYRILLASLPGESEEPRLTVEHLVSSSGLSGSQPARCCNGAGTSKGAYADGSFWLPTLDGVVKLEPRHMQFSAKAPKVLIEQLNTRHRHFENDPLPRLGDQERDLSVHYTAMTYLNPKFVNFRYRLIGYNDKWVEAGTRRTAFFTNLGPGDYRFEVMAANHPGQWSEPAHMRFQVIPRFVESTGFYALAAATGFAVLFILYRLRVRALERVQRQLERMVRQRTEELRELNSRLLNTNIELREVSQRDPLTGLFNRRFVMQRLRLEDASENWLLSPEQSPLILILADIDHFKQINDTHGHASGDELLRQLADLLGNLTRDHDFVVRWGGEEFLIIIRELDPQESTNVAERIRAGIEKHRFSLDNTDLIGVSCSLGLSMYPLLAEGDPLGQWEFAMELADRSLYAAKHGGRNGWSMLTVNDEAAAIDLSQRSSEQIAQLLADGKLGAKSSRTAIEAALKTSLSQFDLGKSSL